MRASWQLSGVLKKEQKLFSSTLRFSRFPNFPGLACSSSLGRGACFAGTIRFSISVYRPAQHADAPSLQLAAVVLPPFPSHRRGHESAAAFSQSAPRPTSSCASPAGLSVGSHASGNFFTARRCFNPRKWHFRTRHPSATPRGCMLRGSSPHMPRQQWW